MIFEATSSELRREETLDYLRDNKFDRVLDVGGALGPWAKEFVTHYLDILNIHDLVKPNPLDVWASPDQYDNEYIRKSESIVGDIERKATWMELLDVHRPEFDFAICTQTLEHVADPTVPLIFMPLAAKEGYVGVPSKFSELRRGIRYEKLRGFMPHRWLFTIREDALWVWPKLPIWEHMGLWVDDIPEKDWHYVELSFRWKNLLPFKIMNDSFYFDYPNEDAICEAFRKEIQIGV